MSDPLQKPKLPILAQLFMAGVSFRTAPIAVRERLAVATTELAPQGLRLKTTGGLDEVVVLSTCNRVEVCGVATAGPRGESRNRAAPFACPAGAGSPGVAERP